VRQEKAKVADWTCLYAGTMARLGTGGKNGGECRGELRAATRVTTLALGQRTRARVASVGLARQDGAIEERSLTAFGNDVGSPVSARVRRQS